MPDRDGDRDEPTVVPGRVRVPRAEGDPTLWPLKQKTILKWLRTPNAILWLRGHNLLGKTCSVYEVAKHLKETNQLQCSRIGVAYIPFSFLKPWNRTAQSLLPGVPKQPRLILPKLPSHRTGPEEHGSALSGPDIDCLLVNLIDTLGEFEQVYIIIDAFDEIGEVEMLPILDLFCKLLGKLQGRASCKLLITGQPCCLQINLRRKPPRPAAEHHTRYQDTQHPRLPSNLASPIWEALLQMSNNNFQAFPFRTGPRVNMMLHHTAAAMTTTAKSSVYHFPHFTISPLPLNPLHRTLGLSPSILPELRLTALQATPEHQAEIRLETIISFGKSLHRQHAIEYFEGISRFEDACVSWIPFSRKACWKQPQPETGRLSLLAEKLFGSEELSNVWLRGLRRRDTAEVPLEYRQKTILQYAVMSGLTAAVKLLIKKGADVNAADADGKRALHTACETDTRGDIVHLLLANGADPTTCDNNGGQPLHTACKAHAPPCIVSRLLSKGADPTACDDHGNIPIVMAARERRLSPIIELFCRTPLDRLGKTRENGETILHSLARHTSEEFMSRLLPMTKDDSATLELISRRDREGCSPLHMAAKVGNMDVIKVLCDRGADINSCDNMGNTPLHLAAEYNQKEAMDLLINKFADPNLENGHHETPLEVVWKKKALCWTSYVIDHERSKHTKMTRGSQAECHVLKKSGPCDSSYRLCRRMRGACRCPERIFRKTYDLSDLHWEDKEEIYRALLRECRNLQRIKHPFIVSYLGYEDLEDHENHEFKGSVLYLEYCDGGDLGVLHILPKKAPQLSHQTGRFSKLFASCDAGRRTNPDTRPLREAEVWTLMYQMFLALAYLHYGFNITANGDWYCEVNWKPLIHRDIKPSNVVMSLADDGSRVAKLCDLGLSRDNTAGQTKARGVGTKGYQPPELEHDEQEWTSKGDVWSLGKTIIALAKDFVPCNTMQKLLDRCTERDPHLRPNSLDVVEEAHKHVAKPLYRAKMADGSGQDGLFIQALISIGAGLDRSRGLTTEVSEHLREQHDARLNLMLADEKKPQIGGQRLENMRRLSETARSFKAMDVYLEQSWVVRGYEDVSAEVGGD